MAGSNEAGSRPEAAYLDPDQDRTSPRIQARAAQIADDYARRGVLHR